MRHGNVPSLQSCAGFYGLELFKGTFERLHKNDQNQLKKFGYPRGYAFLGYSFSAVVPARPRGV